MNTRAKRQPRKLFLAAMIACVTVPYTGHAQAADPAGDSFVLKAGCVITVSPQGPWEYRPGVVVVRDGRIEKVGGDEIDLPADLPLIDLPDATVMPGLVAASGTVRPHKGDESVAAGYLAIDAFDPYADYATLLATGVTTMHISPGTHRLMTGQGAVVKLGGPVGDRVLVARADLSINLGYEVYNPPNHVIYRTPASSDVAIPPAQRQRPSSRMGQLLALDEAIDASAHATGGEYSLHADALATAWRDSQLLRFHARRGADIEAAIRFIKGHQRSGYLVGGVEANLASDAIRRSDLPIVYEMPDPLSQVAYDLGADPDELFAQLGALSTIDPDKLALAVSEDERGGNLRLAAATALKAGLDRRRAIEAITRTPARILGVHARVGTLAPGKDADLLVLSGDPLDASTHVHRAYIGGQLAFAAPKTSALVVRAGTIWVNEELQYRDGSVLIEDGKIAAVGKTVPHPPFARFIDAGRDAFVTPGFIDAYGHLGLDGDEGAPGPDVSLGSVVGVPGVVEHRVAQAGITTVIMSPYSASSQGSQIVAVKTAGKDREQRVVRTTAGVSFDLKAADPMAVKSKLKGRLDAAKKYQAKWDKYEEELAEWREKMAKGESVDKGSGSDEAEEGEIEEDPITGTWKTTISGGPIPEPQTATMKLRLTGDDIEGRIIVPGAPEEAKIVATLDGTHISGEIQVDTGGLGYPTIEAELVETDHIVGTIGFQGLEIDLDALRTDKSEVEFTVVRKRRGKDGRPLPPKVDEALEPLRKVLNEEVPLVATVRTAPQIDSVLAIAEEYEIWVVFRGAEEVSSLVEKLVEQDVGVIVPTQIERWRNHHRYHQADDLSRKGIKVAFQSDSEDGARNLPLVGLHAVERGMSPDKVLAAFTTGPSRMFMLDEEVGSLEVGRHGDLVIFSGHPFEAGSRIERVIINGEEVR